RKSSDHSLGLSRPSWTAMKKLCAPIECAIEFLCPSAGCCGGDRRAPQEPAHCGGILQQSGNDLETVENGDRTAGVRVRHGRADRLPVDGAGLLSEPPGGGGANTGG